MGRATGVTSVLRVPKRELTVASSQFKLSCFYGFVDTVSSF